MTVPKEDSGLSVGEVSVAVGSGEASGSEDSEEVKLAVPSTACIEKTSSVVAAATSVSASVDEAASGSVSVSACLGTGSDATEAATGALSKSSGGRRDQGCGGG